MTTEKEEKKIHFGDILEYVPNERKERFIHDLVLYVPHLKEEADKFNHVVHNVAVGTNMRKYIDLMKDLAMKVYNATGERNRKRENVAYRQMVMWMMYCLRMLKHPLIRTSRHSRSNCRRFNFQLFEKTISKH